MGGGYWRQALVSFVRAVNRSLGYFEYIMIYSFAFFRFSDAFLLFFPGFVLKMQQIIFAINLGLWCTAFAIMSFFAVTKRLKVTKIARQKIITGDSAYETLKELFGKLEKDKGIMTSLEKQLFMI